MTLDIALIDGLKSVDEYIDLSSLVDGKYDVLESKNCHVVGTLKLENERLFADLKVEAELVLASTRTLKPIDYQLSFSLNLIFGYETDADYVLTPVIELDPIIYGHILLEKPLSIYNEGEESVEKEKETNPAFAVLKDWNK